MCLTGKGASFDGPRAALCSVAVQVQCAGSTQQDVFHHAHRTRFVTKASSAQQHSM